MGYFSMIVVLGGDGRIRQERLGSVAAVCNWKVSLCVVQLGRVSSEIINYSIIVHVCPWVGLLIWWVPLASQSSPSHGWSIITIDYPWQAHGRHMASTCYHVVHLYCLSIWDHEQYSSSYRGYIL